MLGIGLRELEYANRVGARILVDMLNGVRRLGVRRQRKLVAAVPVHGSGILRRRVQALYGAVAPVEKDVIELDEIDLAEQAAIALRAGLLMQIGMSGVRRAREIEVAAQHPGIAGVVIRIDSPGGLALGVIDSLVGNIGQLESRAGACS